MLFEDEKGNLLDEEEVNELPEWNIYKLGIRVFQQYKILSKSNY